jgi:PAS domain S-box-containing protein
VGNPRKNISSTREDNWRFSTALKNAAPAVWDWDIAARLLTASPRVHAIYGFARDRKIGLDDLIAATLPEDREWIDELRNGMGGSFRFRITRGGGEDKRWISAQIDVARDTLNLPVAYTATIEDITEQTQAAHALVSSEERLRLAIEAGRMAVWEVDLTSGKATVSPALNLMFGFPLDAQPSFADYRSRYAPGEVERLAKEGATLETVRQRYARGEFAPRKTGAVIDSSDRTQVQAELKIILPDGTVKRLMYRAQYTFSFDGRPVITGLLVDITDRKVAEERLAVVARELQHRVKNSLALAQSLAHQTFRTEPNAASAMEKFMARLRALASATEVVLSSTGAETFIEDVLQVIIAPYRIGAEERLRLEGPRLAVPGKIASAISMIVHELCTNAVKYGALSRDTGRVHFGWRLLPDNCIRFDWLEEGGPPVEAPTRKGFGSRLLEMVVAQQLQGAVEIGFEPSGFSCSITTGPIDIGFAD